MENIEHRTSNLERPITVGTQPHWVSGVGCWMLDVPKFALVFLIRLYRWTISPVLGFLFGPSGGCRFTPTCSQYAIDAIHSHGALVGGWLAVKRVCRCHPWGDCGHDPAPKKEFGVRDSEFGI